MLRTFPRRIILGALAVFSLAGPSLPAETGAAHPVVPGFERFYTDGKADAALGGQLLLGELNCTSCHKSTDTSPLARKPAPILDDVGARVRVGYLRKFLGDPQAVKPGTTMPNLFAGDNDKASKIEALVHYLASTGTIRLDRPDLKGIGPGRDLFHKVGCVACHGTRDGAGRADKVLPSSVPLGDLKAKYSVPSLAAFLENPQRARPGGRMPHVVGTAKDARDIASYLLQGISVDVARGKGSTAFAYFEGAWDRVPNFAKLKPAAAGTGAAFDLGIARRDSNYAVRFEGFFKVERDGTYSFSLSSDDGSNLAIDGKQVVSNDGVHAPQLANGSVKLTRGVHKAVVGFFQAGGGVELDVTISGPGLGQSNLGSLIGATEAALTTVAAPPVKKNDEDYLDIQPELVKKGKDLFVAAGCASCHAPNLDKKQDAISLLAPTLDKLKSDGGCLSAKPVKGLPWYGLSPTQVMALAAALKTPPKPTKDPAVLIARTMATFNCYACHSRDKVGGIQEEWNKFFVTNQPEMGEEARVPPPLDGVGAKLVPEYLKQVLDKGAHDRPYMFTRMPGFGLANVATLAEALSSTDKLPAIPPITLKDPPGRVKAAARHMVGGLALGCIKCHTFNGKKAEGVQGIDMTIMTKRLQRDWYFAYLLDPQKLRPGTRMPTAWTNGKTVLPDVLDGTAKGQIEAIWVYLQDGTRAQAPIGGGGSIPLIPYKEAIIYRNFIQGAGTRAIAVGYPEKAHLAFDANDGRLALLWQGAFMDAGRHWTGRGEGSEPPLGDNILTLPTGVAFAVLEKSAAAWPATSPREQGYRFRGYRLTPDERPTFLYSFGDVKIEDFPNAMPGKDMSIKRTLKLSTEKPVEQLYFRAAAANKIEALEGGWYRIDGWKMKLEGGEPIIRKAGGKSELLVPIRFTDGKAQLVQEFVW